MALPVIKALEFPLTLPIANKQITFRMYTVEDERTLLAAEASKKDDPEFYINNTLNVIKGCINDKEGLLETLSAVDVEYLLLHMRAKSVDEQVKVKYTDPETKKEEVIKFDLTQVEVIRDPEHHYKIQLTETVGITMKDLTFDQKIRYMVKYSDNKMRSNMIYDTIVDCVESVYDEEKVYVVGKDATREEVRVFIDSLTNVSDKLYSFVATLPQLGVKATLKSGVEKTFTSNELDFLAS